MAQYKVEYGQNIYDVALTLYGSVEGILDLLTCNPKLSMDTELKYGDILEYTPYYHEDSTVVSYFKTNGIIPANGTGNVYYKAMNNLLFMWYLKNTSRTVSFSISGVGTLYIDWGDNSDMEMINIASQLLKVSHIYGEDSSSNRKIKVYGEVSIYDLDLSGNEFTDLFTIRDVGVENIAVEDSNKFDLGFTAFMKNIMHATFAGSIVSGVENMVLQKSLMSLDLTNCRLSQEELDRYLIGLVKDYGIRLNCIVNLSENERPSGTYQEPEILIDPKTGMEAIWVLVNHHKESMGPWSFILNENETYTA